MKIFVRTLFVIVYFATALFADWGHSHLAPISFDRIGGIFNHDCGAAEIHKPLDSTDFCFICYQLSTSNSLQNSFDSNSLFQNLSLVSLPVLENPSLGFIFQPIGRAPPQFS
jgi:hypothetical protein